MMIRSIATACLLAALTGCTSGGDPIIDAAFEELDGFRSRGEAPAAPREVVTRAQIDAADTATILARLVSDPGPTMMQAASENGGYVTYFSSFRQSITLRGSQITATRGLGLDLLSATSSANDPLVRPVPPSAWPPTVERRYEFPADSPQGRIETYQCRFEPPGAIRDVTILEVRHVGVEMSETCNGPAGTFENLHLADLETGVVWRSLQWVGAEVDLIDLQIVEPYTGG